MVLAGILLIVTPTTVLVNSIGDSVHDLINGVRDNTLQIPPPSQAVAEWPVVGKKVYGVWSKAHDDLPAVVQSMQPKIGDLSKKAHGDGCQHRGRYRYVPVLLYHRWNHDGLR